MRKTAIVCILFLCLTLSACGAKAPEKAADGAPWGKDWTTIGAFLGVEPMEGWTVRRNEDVLAAEGTFYAFWTRGEAISYTNENCDEATTYDAQIHLVVMELDTPEDAEQTAAQWQSLARERYPDIEESNGEYAGQTYKIAVYPFSDGSCPDSRGASATGIRGSRAIRVDVAVLADFPEEAADVLTDFLEHCHYVQ